MSNYFPYKYVNNLSSQLSTAISSSATSVQLNSWEWERRWTEFPIIATLENFNNDWKVAKREIVIITARSWDVLTITRKAFQCFPTDDDNSLAYKSRSFDSWDTISNYIAKEYLDEIENATNDLYDNWVKKLRTDIVSWLQIHVNWWSVLVWSSYYDFEWWNLTLTDNATNYVEIDEDWNLVSNTTWRTLENTKISKVITSSWNITSIEDRRLWTVWWKIWWTDIHQLTEKNVLVDDDEFIIADSENIYQNKKVKFSQFQSWLSYDSDIEAGENISEWDVIFRWFPCYSENLVLNSTDFGGTNTKVAIKQISNWITPAYVDVFLKATSWSDATWLTMNVETDNNWKPSWTALSSQDIFSMMRAVSFPITQSSLLMKQSVYMPSFIWWISDDWSYICWEKSYNWNILYMYTYPTPYSTSWYSIFSQYSNSTWYTQFVMVNPNYYIAHNWTQLWLFYTSTAYKVADITMTSSYTVSVPASWHSLVSIAMSRDWMHLYVLWSKYNYSYNSNFYIVQYDLSTAFDLSTATEKRSRNLWSIGYTNNSSVGLFYCEGYLIFSWLMNSNYKVWIITIPLSSDWTMGEKSSVNERWSAQFWVNRFSYDMRHCMMWINSSSWYLYVYKNVEGLDTALKKKHIVFDSTVNVSKWDTFRITFEPTGWSGDRFSLWYINKNTTNYCLSQYDWTNWGDDTTKYPYAFCLWNTAQFCLKASVDNQWTTTRQAMIVRKNANAFDKVSYDFFWISKKLSNLLAWDSYYLSSTPWQITTDWSWFKVGEALSETDLLLTTS